ncbi:MAG: Gldg family protein [bacterium]
MSQSPSKAEPVQATGRRTLRASSFLAVTLGAVFALLVIVFAYRLNFTLEVSVGKVMLVSERTRNVLAETQGLIKISCSMDRRHPMFRPVSRLLRGLRQAARRVAGAEIVIEYVDPRWDLARAGQLAAWGVPENALLFERQRRRIVVTLDEMLTRRSLLRAQEERGSRGDQAELGVFRGERVCAAAISRLTLPYERSVVYWLQGHGEVRFDDYDDLRGFSDIARELKRDGFELRELALPGLSQLPADCHVLVIAGARYALAAEEQNLLEAFLQHGGRLLYLVAPRVTTGVEKVLEKWGIRLTPFIAASSKTLSGQEVVITSFADHVVTRNLNNAAVVFGYATCLEAVTDPMVTVGADRPKVTLLAQTDAAGWGESQPDVFPRHFDSQSELHGPVAVAAVSERGGNVAKDVAFKPTRVCVIGEADFVMNGALATRANANRDLFMNAVSWLAGVDTGTAPSLGGDATLVTGFDRHHWVFFMISSAVVVPGCVFLLFSLVALRMQR